jgi:predicted nucleotidyltransferase component of viral defense system
MLTRTQIQRIAQRNQIGAQAQERDYIQNILLYLLYGHSHALIFKGGTALRMIYRGNRYSEDLDFNGPDDVQMVQSSWVKIVQDCELFGIQAEIRNSWQSGSGYSFDFSYQGPLYDGRDRSKGKVRIDTSLRQENVATQVELVKPEYDDLRPFTIIALTPEELLAEKIRALLMRGKPRDVYDIWLLNQHGVHANRELVETKLRGYNVTFNEPSVQAALEKARQNWERDLLPLLPQLISWEVVTAQIGISPNL